MSLNIRALMGQSLNYNLNSRKSLWLEEVAASKKDEKWVIIREKDLRVGMPYEQIREIRKNFNIGAMFQLRNIYNESFIDMVLVQFTKKSVSNVKVALYFEKNSTKKEPKANANLTLIEISPEYLNYIRCLEQWINGSYKYVENDRYEMSNIPINEIVEDKCYPTYFTSEAIKVRKYLADNKTKTVPLTDIAEIVAPSNVNGAVKCVSARNCKYPFDIENIETTNLKFAIELQKGDIILSRFGEHKAFLIPEDVSGVYVQSDTYLVIRLKKGIYSFCPEYLWLFLQSNIAKAIFDSSKLGLVVSRLSTKDVESFPIVVPMEPLASYIEKARVLTTFGISSETYSTIKQSFKQEDSIEDVLNAELIESIKVHNKNELSLMLKDDVRELNVCYRNKAYKAAIILAGSILEAVLIDWLSEIKGINYFEKEYHGENNKIKNAVLKDYIDAIGVLKVPEWMEKEKANVIRSRRNLVHAKLCVKTNDVNEATCKQVIDYLIEILKTRGYRG